MPAERSYFLAMCIIALSLPVSASDTAAPAKIAPSLASQTALGGSSEALIVFSEQADLSGAANLKTKLEKGRYVYNALRAVAERTQAPMRKMLQERGIPFQSFYGVNMIKLTASRDLLYELAGHNEVQRIEANPKVRSSIPVPNLSLPTTQQLDQQSLTTARYRDNRMERGESECAASMGPRLSR